MCVNLSPDNEESVKNDRQGSALFFIVGAN